MLPASPIQRAGLPADISDSVNYLQSFMHSQSSASDTLKDHERYAHQAPPTQTSSSPRWGEPPSIRREERGNRPQSTWTFSSGTPRRTTPYTVSPPRDGFSSAGAWTRSRPRPLSAATSPLRDRFTYPDTSSRYRELSLGDASQGSSFRYGWQRADRARGLGGISSVGRASSERSGAAHSAAMDSWTLGSSGLGGVRVASLWRAPLSSPVRPWLDDGDSERGERLPRHTPSASSAVPRARSHRDGAQRPPPTVNHAHPESAKPVERAVDASRADHDRFASRPPSRAQLPLALPPRVPSTVSRPSSSMATSATGDDEEGIGAYEVVIDVDESAEEDDDRQQAEHAHEAAAAALAQARRTAEGVARQPRDAEAVPSRQSPPQDRSSPRRRAPNPPAVRTDQPTSPPPRIPASLAHALALQAHDQNLQDFACYLKNYYACDTTEAEKGLETMEPQDVLGLAQCFYVDLYRIVRTLRSGLNLPIHMFSDGDPTDALVIATPAVPAGGAARDAHGESDWAPSRTSAPSAQSWQRPQPTAPQRTSPHRPSEAEHVQRIEARVPVLTARSAAHTPAQRTLDVSLDPSSSRASTGAGYRSTGLAATRALSPEQVLAGSPSPPYRTSASPPSVSPRSATTTPRRRATSAQPPSAAGAARRRNSVAGSTASASSGTSASTGQFVDPPVAPIAKRPLKSLMPVLRDGAYLVKHNSSLRSPHLRWFQIQDCVDSFHGRDVLMPHLTWAHSPTAASKLTSDTACNLVKLESVAVGAGKGPADKAWKLFKRKKGHVVNHEGKPIPTGMCVVLQFSEKGPIGLSFLSEDARQTWVSALMGVVERNRTITAKA